MEPNSGILTHSLQQFISQFKLGLGALRPDAVSLLSLLCILELTIAALWWGYSGNEALGKLIKKLLMFGFFIWVVENYDSLIQVVLRGFVESGAKAGGQPGVTNIMEDPSRIIDEGLIVVKPMLDMAIDLSTSWNLFDALFSLISLLVIFMSFIVLAAQVFITRVEFALVSTLGLILLPFGVFKQTAFMAEKVFGAIFTFGVKMMVLAFIVTVAFPLIQKYQFPPEFDWIHMLSLMATSITFAILALRAPGVASAVISGAPSLAAGAVGAAGGLVTGTAAAGAGLSGAAISSGNGSYRTIAAAVGTNGGSDKGGGSSGGGGAGSGSSSQNSTNENSSSSKVSTQTSDGGRGSQSASSTIRNLKEEFVDSIGRSSGNQPEQATKGAEPALQKEGNIVGRIKRAVPHAKEGIESVGEKLGSAKGGAAQISSALKDEGQAGAGINIPLRASNDD